MFKDKRSFRVSNFRFFGPARIKSTNRLMPHVRQPTVQQLRADQVVKLEKIEPIRHWRCASVALLQEARLPREPSEGAPRQFWGPDAPLGSVDYRAGGTRGNL